MNLSEDEIYGGHVHNFEFVGVPILCEPNKTLECLHLKWQIRNSYHIGKANAKHLVFLYSSKLFNVHTFVKLMRNIVQPTPPSPSPQEQLLRSDFNLHRKKYSCFFKSVSPFFITIAHLSKSTIYKDARSMTSKRFE